MNWLYGSFVPKDIPYVTRRCWRHRGEVAGIVQTASGIRELESLIERGRSRAANVIDQVVRHQPTDRLVRGDALEFRATDNLPEILITVPDWEQEKVDQTLHRNAIYQMAQTTDMPVKFLDSLQTVGEPWGRELLAHKCANRLQPSGVTQKRPLVVT